MTQTDPEVHIVDDDDAVRDSLLELLDSVGIQACGHASAKAFLDGFDESLTGCIVLDVRMPGMSGPELQQELAERGSVMSIIFVTGHGDVPMAVEAMKKGAIEFIQKPFREQELLDCIQSALEISRQQQRHQAERQEVASRLEALTAREKEILDWIVNGHSNKRIALELDISQRTVENHRAHILEKMGVRTTAALLKFVLSKEPGA